MKHRPILAAVYLLALFVAPVFAQTGTQPPAGNNPDRICEYDSNTGTIGLRLVPAGTGNNLPRGVATEGNPTQADNGQCQQPANPSPMPTPPPVDVSAREATATPVASAATVGPSVTPTATEAPASTPEPMSTLAPTETPTPFVLVPEPTVRPGPLPPCVQGPDGRAIEEPCGGKG